VARVNLEAQGAAVVLAAMVARGERETDILPITARGPILGLLYLPEPEAEEATAVRVVRAEWEDGEATAEPAALAGQLRAAGYMFPVAWSRWPMSR
jgi:hypothetical protein